VKITNDTLTKYPTNKKTDLLQLVNRKQKNATTINLPDPKANLGDLELKGPYQ
jgi:hypothetical protein